MSKDRKIGWGGKRTGAGRKPVIDEIELFLIGAKAETLSRRLARRRAQIEHRAKVSEINALHQNAKAVPVPERKEWLRTFEGQDHVDDVDSELNILAEREGRAPSRLLRIEYRQVRGSRRCVIERVARWASRRYCIRVTPSLVDRSWKAFRRNQHV